MAGELVWKLETWAILGCLQENSVLSCFSTSSYPWDQRMEEENGLQSPNEGCC